MDEYEDLLKKKFYCENAKYEKYSKPCGILKKKTERGAFGGLLNKSTQKFFCFHLKGRYLCYYEKEPVSNLSKLINRKSDRSLQTLLMLEILKKLKIILKIN